MSYPEPPKDMWYEVPQDKPKPEAPPRAIFPWERHGDRPQPTRRFVEDQPKETPKPKEKHKPAGLQMPPAIAVDDDIFTPFSPQVNAWDSNPNIERYVRAVFEQQNPHRHRPQPSHEQFSPIGTTRRESLILTDFPTADDRPSLPVTPAPIRRPSFWGDERDEAGELPAAEGVPDQAEWVCPQCGFSSDTLVAFLRASPASSALEREGVTQGDVEQFVSTTAAPVMPAVESIVPAVAPTQPARLPSPPMPTPPSSVPSRNAWDDIPLPAHLRPRPRARFSSSDFSSASTAVGPSIPATAGPDDLPQLGSDAPSPVPGSLDAQAGIAGKAVNASFEDSSETALANSAMHDSGDITPTAPSPPPQQILPPPAWLTGPLKQ
jgi:glycogenin glucosyltransferase